MTYIYKYKSLECHEEINSFNVVNEEWKTPYCTVFIFHVSLVNAWQQHRWISLTRLNLYCIGLMPRFHKPSVLDQNQLLPTSRLWKKIIDALATNCRAFCASGGARWMADNRKSSLCTPMMICSMHERGNTGSEIITALQWHLMLLLSFTSIIYLSFIKVLPYYITAPC